MNDLQRKAIGKLRNKGVGYKAIAQKLGLSVNTVKFDPRPSWVLLAKPIGARPRRQELVWMHPEDSRFVWVRTFHF